MGSHTSLQGSCLNLFCTLFALGGFNIMNPFIISLAVSLST